jgi:hypothetical protein
MLPSFKRFLIVDLKEAWKRMIGHSTNTPALWCHIGLFSWKGDVKVLIRKGKYAETSCHYALSVVKFRK